MVRPLPSGRVEAYRIIRGVAQHHESRGRPAPRSAWVQDDALTVWCPTMVCQGFGRRRRPRAAGMRERVAVSGDLSPGPSRLRVPRPARCARAGAVERAVSLRARADGAVRNSPVRVLGPTTIRVRTGLGRSWRTDDYIDVVGHARLDRGRRDGAPPQPDSCMDVRMPQLDGIEATGAAWARRRLRRAVRGAMLTRSTLYDYGAGPAQRVIGFLLKGTPPEPGAHPRVAAARRCGPYGHPARRGS